MTWYLEVLKTHVTHVNCSTIIDYLLFFIDAIQKHVKNPSLAKSKSQEWTRGFWLQFLLIPSKCVTIFNQLLLWLFINYLKLQISLIHLLVRQKISPFDLEGLADLKSHTLKFTLKTQGHQQKVPKDKNSHQVSVQPAALRQAILFIQVVLKSPDKKRTLELPVFPVLAPQMVKDSSSSSSWSHKDEYF